MEDPLGVHVSAREIYDEIVGMRGDVRSLTESREDTHDTLADHESRLRSIERWKYAMPVATLAAIASAFAAFYQSK